MRLTVLVMTIVFAASLALAASMDITSSEVRKLLEKNKQTFLLDVRTPEEYRQARLKGAVLIPLSDLQRRAKEVPGNRPVVIYCAVGSRSRTAANYLSQQGYRTVYNMSDGIVGWYRSGYPVEK